MKNIHVLSTDKTSRLFVYDGKLGLAKGFQYGSDAIQNQNIYITNDKKIKEGDWVLIESDYDIQGTSIKKYNFKDEHYDNCLFKKIILTTDKDLIKDGVQAIDDEFLEWFVSVPFGEIKEIEVEKLPYDGTKSITKYWGGEYKIILPKEEPKQETLEEAINRIKSENEHYIDEDAFELGAKWQQERMCNVIDEYVNDVMGGCNLRFEQWFEQFKK